MTVTLKSYIKSISGRDLVYYRCGVKQLARRYVVPKNPDTPVQRIFRGLFADAVFQWQNLPRYKKEQWNRRARFLQMSGYNLFISKMLCPDKGGSASTSPDVTSLSPSCLSVFTSSLTERDSLFLVSDRFADMRIRLLR